MLPAYVDIMIATGDVQRRALGPTSSRRSQIPRSSVPVRGLRIAAGSVLLAAGDAPIGVIEASARRSGVARPGRPYETARVRVLIGARVEPRRSRDATGVDGAEQTFEQLGATPISNASMRSSVTAGRSVPGGLSPRERWKCFGSSPPGLTNREIATELVLFREDGRAPRQQHLRQDRSRPPVRPRPLRTPTNTTSSDGRSYVETPKEVSRRLGGLPEGSSLSRAYGSAIDRTQRTRRARMTSAKNETTHDEHAAPVEAWDAIAALYDEHVAPGEV